MRKSSHNKPLVTWKTMVKIEEIQPRKGKWNTYCLLRTAIGNFSCSERLAQQLCLFEPYELIGQVRFVMGGIYLWCTKAELFNSQGYRQAFTFPGETEGKVCNAEPL